MSPRLNPGELEIDLFCKGIRISESCMLEEDARLFSRTRAGLGSGLELVIPGDLKDIWMNAPVEEDFAADSPYALIKEGGEYYALHEGEGEKYLVKIPPEPAWYSRKTTSGTPMHSIGVLQGTYLGVYINEVCNFWVTSPMLQCKFCTTGLNVGVNERGRKNVDDVVEVAQAAKEESRCSFIHLNSGYQGGKGLDLTAPYIKALKERVGILTGVQVVPSKELWKYDWIIDLGADHFSFCYELHNPEYFAKYLPGKEQLVKQETFFRAMEYTSRKLGKGRVSGEIIAGVEPIEDTLKAIDYITSVGAFPTVCIFRPVIGAEMERWPSPSYDDMITVFRHVYESCRRNKVPVGMAPNIEVSLVVQPDDAKYLAQRDWQWMAYELKMKLFKAMMAPYFRYKLMPRHIKADVKNNEAYRRGTVGGPATATH